MHARENILLRINKSLRRCLRHVGYTMLLGTINYAKSILYLHQMPPGAHHPPLPEKRVSPHWPMLGAF